MATGELDFTLNVVIPNPTIARTSLRWKGDECLPAGRQMARLIFDPTKTGSIELPLEGISNQPMGMIKSLIYSIKLYDVRTGDTDSFCYSFDVESSQNLMRVSLGPPALEGNGTGSTIDVLTVCGAMPFYCDSTLPIRIVYNDDSGAVPTEPIDVRLFFCNFEVPPYTMNTFQQGTD
jgi:hypothetical protein